MSVKRWVEVTLTRDRIEEIIKKAAEDEAKPCEPPKDLELDWSDWGDNDRVVVRWEEETRG